MVSVNVMGTREFERSRWHLAHMLGVAVLVGFFGLLMARGGSVRSGIPFFAMALFQFGLWSWSVRTPYVTTTDDGITAFIDPLHKVKARWDEVRDVSQKGWLLGGNLVLVLKTGRRVGIPLFYLDKEGREALIQHVRDIVAARGQVDLGSPDRRD